MISIESEERPLCRFFVLHDEPTYKLKRIEVDPGGRLSFQYNHKISEAWTLAESIGVINLKGQDKETTKGQKLLIPQEVKHRIENEGLKDEVFIEVQKVSYLRFVGVDNIVRNNNEYNGA